MHKPLKIKVKWVTVIFKLLPRFQREKRKANLAPSGEESDSNLQSAQIDRGHLERQASSPMGATKPSANLSQFVPS